MLSIQNVDTLNGSWECGAAETPFIAGEKVEWEVHAGEQFAGLLQN